MESEQIRLNIKPLLGVLLLPALVYIISVASYVGSSSNSSYTIARVASIVLDVMNAIRFLIALSSFLFSMLIKETGFVDYNVLLMSNIRYSC